MYKYGLTFQCFDNKNRLSALTKACKLQSCPSLSNEMFKYCVKQHQMQLCLGYYLHTKWLNDSDRVNITRLCGHFFLNPQYLNIQVV